MLGLPALSVLDTENEWVPSVDVSIGEPLATVPVQVAMPDVA